MTDFTFDEVDVAALTPTARQTLLAAWLIADGHSTLYASEAVGIEQRDSLSRRLDQLAAELTEQHDRALDRSA
jgi:hypothetical protein